MGELGDPEGHPTVDPVAGRPSAATGGVSEKCGSSTRKDSKTQKRTKQILEKWPQASAERERVLEGKDQTSEKSRGVSRQRIVTKDNGLRPENNLQENTREMRRLEALMSPS